jgi:hypothetical protein
MSAPANSHASSTTQPDAESNPDRVEDQTFKRGFVGVLNAERVELRTAAAGLVFGQKDVVLEQSGARDVVSAGAVQITRGGAGIVLAGGDATIRQGGAGTMVSLGRMDIEQGGACLLVARDATVGRGGLVLLGITPHLEVAEGGRVFGGPAAAAAALAGIGIGFVVGLLLSRR